MRKKTRSSAKVLRWKASGPPNRIASDPSAGAMELVQQELPLKEGTAGLRVITIILAVMLLHVLFIGGIALYNLLGGGGKSPRSEGGAQKGGATAPVAAGLRPAGNTGDEGVGTAPTLPAAGPHTRRGGEKGQTDPSSLSNAEETGRKKGSKRRLRRVSTREGGNAPAKPESATATGQGAGESRTGSGASPVLPQSGSANPAASAPAAPHAYHVVRGDTLWRIARRFHVGLDELMAANRLTPASKLHIGQELQIPAAKAGRGRLNADASGG